MGTKRPFDEELQQFIKHPKQFDYGNKLALFSENKAPYEASQNASPGEAGCMLYKFHSGEDPENEYDASDLADKEFETPAPLSFVNSTGGDAVAGSGAVFCSSLFPEYFEFNFPSRPLVHIDDTYSSLLNCSPRKEIPLGPNHQADIPILESEVAGEQTLHSGDDGGDRFLGACVITMPNPEQLLENGQDASDTVDCKCLDSGSIICVQQHVKEAREKLRETLGHEKFMNLGFYNIGEEIANRWSEEEERLFHETIYSNPVSLRKKFWEILSTAFPSRTKKEIVSYYFNVFILRRRAVQNRSKLLEIDSDDDEWRGNDREPITVGGDNEDFVVGSFIGQDVRVDHGDDSSSDDGGDNFNDGGDDVLIGVVDAVEKDNNGFSNNEDSHTSLESQQNLPNSCGPVDERLRQENEENSEKGKSLHQNSDGMLGSEYAVEPCDGKIWDSAPYSMGLTNSVDLLSTCSMIEEIFGPSRSDNSIS